MSQENYNDVTIVWTPTVGQAVTVPHVGLNTDDGAADVDDTVCGASLGTHLDGIADLTAQCNFGGSGDGLLLGALGALAVTGMNGSLAAAAIFEKTVSGTEDGAIEGSITIRPVPAA